MNIDYIPAVCISAANTTSSVSASESVSQNVKYGKVTSISGTKIKLALGEYTEKAAPDGMQDGQTPPEKPENDGNAHSRPKSLTAARSQL